MEMTEKTRFPVRKRVDLQKCYDRVVNGRIRRYDVTLKRNDSADRVVKNKTFGSSKPLPYEHYFAAAE